MRELRSLRGRRSFTARHRRIPEGTTTLPVYGKALEIKADLRVGSAEEAGLKVRTGDGEETVIGYDAQAAELYVDRTRSGRVDFSRDFPGVQRAPLAPRHGRVRLRVLVDWSSVEVFADRGQTVITDQIFPSASSDGVELFADGGSATLNSLKIRHLRSSWATSHHNGWHRQRTPVTPPDSHGSLKVQPRCGEGDGVAGNSPLALQRSPGTERTVGERHGP